MRFVENDTEPLGTGKRGRPCGRFVVVVIVAGRKVLLLLLLAVREDLRPKCAVGCKHNVVLLERSGRLGASLSMVNKNPPALRRFRLDFCLPLCEDSNGCNDKLRGVGKINRACVTREHDPKSLNSLAKTWSQPS
jgi:hypothetical protein